MDSRALSINSFTKQVRECRALFLVQRPKNDIFECLLCGFCLMQSPSTIVGHRHNVAAAISGTGALEIGSGTFAAGTSLTNAEVSIINGGNYKPVVIATNLTYAGFWNDIFNSAPLQINHDRCI